MFVTMNNRLVFKLLPLPPSKLITANLRANILSYFVYLNSIRVFLFRSDTFQHGTLLKLELDYAWLPRH